MKTLAANFCVLHCLIKKSHIGACIPGCYWDKSLNCSPAALASDSIISTGTGCNFVKKELNRSLRLIVVEALKKNLLINLIAFNVEKVECIFYASCQLKIPIKIKYFL